MTNAKQILPEPTSFVRENLIWILGIVPFLMAAFQILKVSSGDPTVTTYLVTNLDISKFFLALLLPAIPIIGFWLGVAWLQVRSRLPEPQKGSLEWSIYPTYAIMGILLIAMSVIAFVTSVILVSVLFLVSRWFHDRKLRKSGTFESDNRLQMRPLVLGFALALNALINSTAISWLPPEIISVERQPNVTARVLAADGDWTTYLDTDRKVHITATKKIQLRVPCSTASTITSKPLAIAIASAIGRDQDPNRACPPSGSSHDR